MNIDEIIVRNDNSSKAFVIAEYKAEAVEALYLPKDEYFYEWRQQQNDQFAALRKDNQELKKQNDMLRAKIDFLIEQEKKRQEEEDRRKQEEKEKEEAKLKRKNRKKQPLRDYICPNEYKEVMDLANIIYKKPFILRRVKIALTLLYLTGLRISNLLGPLWGELLFALINGEKIFIKLIKKGLDRYPIKLTSKGLKVLQEFGMEIVELAKDQPELTGPFFFSSENPSRPINADNFNKQCNRVLTRYSQIKGKVISPFTGDLRRSHCFRATLVTDLLEHTKSIEQVKDIMGHKSIGTTEKYRRSSLAESQVTSILGKVHKERAKGFLVESDGRSRRRSPKGESLWPEVPRKGGEL